MPSWIYLLCREPVHDVDAGRLLRGIMGKERKALAGVDYLTLAEQYPVGKRKRWAKDVEDALSHLRVTSPAERGDVAYAVHYADWPARPIALYRWDSGSIGTDLLARVLQKAPEDVKATRFRQLIGVQLWRHQLADMGVVLAYEVARYLGQLGRAVVLNDEGDWQEIERGGWRPLGARSSKGFNVWESADDNFLAEARARNDSLTWILKQGRGLFFEFDGRATRAAALLASFQEAARGQDLPELLDALVDDAMDCGGMNYFTPPAKVTRRLHELVGALPMRRAEALVAPPTGVRWRFVLDQPTPFVIEQAVAEVRNWPRVTNMYVRYQAIEALPRLGPNAVRPLIEALEHRCPQRIVLLASLAAIGSPEGLESLVAHLADPVDRVRAVAEWGLQILGPQTAGKRLAVVATAKKKTASESARRLLRSWGRGKRATKASSAKQRWCAGCGLVTEDREYPCPFCGKELESVPSAPWRAIASPSCPVDLRQT